MQTPPPVPAGPSHTLDEFVRSTTQQDKGQGLFEKETDRLLEVNLNGRVNTKMGSMVAYQGNIHFTREKALDQGLGNLLKKAVSGEGMSIKSRTDTSLRTFIGRGSGESFQMLFEGSGFVVIQPYEEVIAAPHG